MWMPKPQKHGTDTSFDTIKKKDLAETFLLIVLLRITDIIFCNRF